MGLSPAKHHLLIVEIRRRDKESVHRSKWLVESSAWDFMSAIPLESSSQRSTIVAISSERIKCSALSPAMYAFWNLANSRCKSFLQKFRGFWYFAVFRCDFLAFRNLYIPSMS